MKLSVVIITRNEEKRIGNCLESVKWVDEMIVLDSFSSDHTVEICRGFGAKVFQQSFTNFPAQRNAAINLASGYWIFFLDADERVTPELAAELKENLAGKGVAPNEVVGYWVPRRNIIWGKWIRHGGWYPDYQLRLFQKGKALYDESRQVHEILLLDGPAGYLRNPLLHYNYDNVSQFLAKQDFYADFEARTMFQQGIKPKGRNFILQPWREFKRRYWGLRGYKDGWHGFLLSLLLAYFKLFTYKRLWQLWRESAKPSKANPI